MSEETTVLDSIEGQDRRICAEAMETPMLSSERENELVQRWLRTKNTEQPDEAAREELVRAHQKLVVGVVSRYRRGNVSFQDLVSEGNIGLMRALDRFDPAMGNRFATYGHWWVLTMVQEYITRNLTVIRLGRSRSERDVTRRMASGHDEQEESDPRAEFIRGALNPMPFDGRDEDDIDFNAILPADDGGPDQRIEDAMREQRVSIVHQLLGELGEREAEVVRLRRLSDKPPTLRALSQRMAISPERVRQIEHAGLNRMRDLLERRGLNAADIVPTPA